MTRRRSPRRRVSGPLVGLALVCALLSGGIASSAFDTGTASRPASAAVTTDADGAHSLDVAQSVSVNSTSRLVDVTNLLARDVSVTVTLRSDSTAAGDLVVSGRTEGDAVTFSLADGQTVRVSIAVPDDEALVGQTVYFHVTASAPGFTVSARNRSVPIT